MRDEDHGPVAAALAADDLEDLLGEVGGQCRGHLVEHQHVGLDRERAREVDDALRGERHLADLASEVQPLDAQLVQPVPELVERCLGEPQVRADVEVGDQGRFLVDRDDAAAAGVGRRVGHARLAADADRPRVRPDGAGQDLDERALAGAVGAHERVDLARAHGERRRLQRDDGAVRLCDR